jgi:16S rRNA (guanine966-N2)-methyltransferase
LRIIAGIHRGRRLAAPKGLETRPTTDRVREAWFSILGPIEGIVLDLYAGTGALGLEALSRGAEHAVFIESSRRAAEVIRKNAETLGVTQQVSLVVTRAENCAGVLSRHAPFGLILTDPPWTAWDAAEQTLTRLLSAQLLTPNGRLVLGHPKQRPIQLPAKAGLVAESERSWGDSAATFFRRAETEEDQPARQRPSDIGSPEGT